MLRKNNDKMPRTKITKGPISRSWMYAGSVLIGLFVIEAPTLTSLPSIVCERFYAGWR